MAGGSSSGFGALDPPAAASPAERPPPAAPSSSLREPRKFWIVGISTSQNGHLDIVWDTVLAVLTRLRHHYPVLCLFLLVRQADPATLLRQVEVSDSASRTRSSNELIHGPLSPGARS